MPYYNTSVSGTDELLGAGLSKCAILDESWREMVMLLVAMPGALKHAFNVLSTTT